MIEPDLQQQQLNQQRVLAQRAENAEHAEDAEHAERTCLHAVHSSLQHSCVSCT